MSSVAAKISCFVESLALNAIFTSRELLHLGSRNAIDLALSKLVKKLKIKRLASGVFIAMTEQFQTPSALDIVKAKAFAFGKRLLELSALAKNSNESQVFCTDGCTSSFRSIHGRLSFKHVGPKTFGLNESGALVSFEENNSNDNESAHAGELRICCSRPAMRSSAKRLSSRDLSLPQCLSSPNNKIDKRNLIIARHLIEKAILQLANQLSELDLGSFESLFRVPLVRS